MPPRISVHTRIHFWGLLAIWFFVTACAVVEPNPSCVDENSTEIYIQEIIQTYKAHEYYERGKAYAAHDCCQSQAIDDFLTAIDLDQEDNWRKRKNRFTAAYFPNRELGIAYYHQGQYTFAEKQLLASLGQAHSDRAVYFLKRTREALVVDRQAGPTKPSIQVSWGPQPHWTKDEIVTLTGWVEDENYIAELSIDGRSEYMIAHPPAHRFRRVFKALPNGRHRIAIRAVNLMRDETSKTITVHVDRIGPTISIDAQSSLTATNGGLFEITGTLQDDAGLAKLESNGRTTDTYTGDTHTTFTSRFSADEQRAVLIAYDRLGNSSQLEIPLDDQSNKLTGFFASSEDAAMRLDPLSIKKDKKPRPPFVSFAGFLRKLDKRPRKYYKEEVIVPIKVNDPIGFFKSVRLKSYNAPQGQNTPTESNPPASPLELSQSYEIIPNRTSKEQVLKAVSRPIQLKFGQNRIVLEATVNGQNGRTIICDEICLNRVAPKELRETQRVTIALKHDWPKHPSFNPKLRETLKAEKHVSIATADSPGAWKLTHIVPVCWPDNDHCHIATQLKAIIMSPDGGTVDFDLFWPEGIVKYQGANGGSNDPSLAIGPDNVEIVAAAFARSLLTEFPPLEGSVQSIAPNGKIVVSDISYARPLEDRPITIFQKQAGIGSAGELEYLDEIDFPPRKIAHARIRQMGPESTEADIFRKFTNTKAEKGDLVVTNYSLTK